MEYNYTISKFGFKSLFVFILIFLGLNTGWGQAFPTWQGSGSNWDNASNWSVAYGYGQLQWTGAGSTTSNNDYSSTSQWRLFFNGNTSYTLTGNEVILYDYSGAIGGIMSRASGNVNIQLPVRFSDNSDRPAFISTRMGGSGSGGGGGTLTLGNLTIAGNVNALRFSTEAGAGNIIVTGVVSGDNKPVVIGRNHNNDIQSNTLVIFSGANTYTGDTNIEAGTLRLSGSGNLGNNSAVRISSGAVLDLNNVNVSVPSVAERGTTNGGTIALGSGTLTVLGGWGVNDPLYQNSISGTGNLVKQGTGILDLYGSQSYTGTTLVSGGVLRGAVNLSTSLITIENGGTFSLRAANDISVNSITVKNGGILNIPAGRTLTINGTLTIEPGAIINYNSTGLIAYGSSGSLVYDTASSWEAGKEWAVAAPPFDVTILSGSHTFASNRVANGNLTIASGADVTLDSGLNLTVKGDVINNGSFTLENNANLLQEGTVNNNEGAIVVKRNSSALKRLDYTLWSSPVSGQNLRAFSPLTVLDRFYVYNTFTNTYSNSTSSLIDPVNDDFATAKGYMIRMPNNHPTWATIWNGQFTGVPHNGDISFTMVDSGAGQRFNLVGNPYPSPISALAFVEGNPNITGTLYFWRKTNNPLMPSYCVWTYSNGIGTFTTNGEDEAYDLHNIIRTGQGFFVEANGSGTALNFTNDMRVGDTANQFFRYSNQAQSSEAHRFWLNATGEGAFSQMVIGYFTGATNDVDQNIDGRYINDGAIALNSIINDVDYVIQGRALPFDTEDAVPLSFRATTAGSYTIEIDHTDGLFSSEQDIFVEDMQLQVFHNLKETPYTFESEAGVFNDRFRIVYQNGTMNTGDYQLTNAVIFVKDKMLYASTGNDNIAKITIYDVRGSILKTITGLNVNQAEVNLSDVASQVLLVRLETQDNRVITKKVVR